MDKVFITQIKERDQVDSSFLVRDKITAMARNGKPYLTLKLVDRTGEVEGRVWDRVDEISARFAKDDFIRIRGKASVYMGRMQLVVQELQRLDEAEVNLADFLPVAERAPEEMVEDLRRRVGSIENAHLRQLMEAFLADERFLAGFSKAPAAKSMHHVYLGGLLEHSLAVADLAEDVCRRYPDLNRDLLITGALLHDIGKTTELAFQRSFDYTDAGKLLGHIIIGVEMVEEKIRRIDDFPVSLATMVKHLLLSHHGQYEYGSPKRPKTLEAVVLNFLDDMDSKINGVRTHIEREPDNPSSWTGYHRLYDRYFFKEPVPDAAALPGAEEAEPGNRMESPPSNPGGGRREHRGGGKDRRLGFTLGDQLKGKSLDLFSADDETKE